MSRRTFLKSTVGIGAGLCASGLSPCIRRASAIEPIERPHNPRLKVSLAAYSLRERLQRKRGTDGAMDLNAFVTYCATLGLDGAELTQYYFPKPTDSDYLYRLRRHAHLSGIDISGGAIGNKFTLDVGSKLDEQVTYANTWIANYAKLGAPVVRVFAGKPPEGTSEEAAIERAVPRLQQACETAGRHGTMLAIENHDFTTKIDHLLQIVRSVDSPWFGVNFDSGNFHHSTDPYADMVRIAPYAVNAQIKVAIRTRNGNEPADLGRIVEILRNAGYAGYLVLEYEEDEDPLLAIPRYIDQLRELTG